MIDFEAAELAAAAGAKLLAGSPASPTPAGPSRAVIDSRQAGPGDLFFGLTGENHDGGRFAAGAIEAGCWGVVVRPPWAEAARAATGPGSAQAQIFVTEQPLAALQQLARAWRHRLGADGATVAGITGSVGKTSTKDIARALLPRPVHASAENLNTEIGLPLSLLEAPAGMRSVVLEMAMRGAGQIAELSAIAEPDIGAITNVGPVHTELLGSIEAVAAAKAELLSGLKHGAWAVVPAEPGPLAPFIEAERERLRMLRFGPGGDVEIGLGEASGAGRGPGESGISGEVRLSGAAAELAGAIGSSLSARFDFPFDAAHNLVNATAAIAIGLAAGIDLETMAGRAGDISFSRFRGERLAFSPGFELVNDCYNANPLSMRAALDHLGSTAGGRRIAVLGLMAELGPEQEDHHRSVGAYAREVGVDLLVGVGPEARWYGPDELVADPAEAAELLAGMAGKGDTVLVKGSRSAGLEAVAESLALLLEDPDRAGEGDA